MKIKVAEWGTPKNIFKKARFLDIIEKNCQKLLFLVLFRALMKEKYYFLHLKKQLFVEVVLPFEL